ncbi:MAG: PAS domain S-box protein [Steroidobacteraceae bacterium]
MPVSASHELQALLDVATDAVVIIDHHGIIQSFNAAAERMFGYPAAEALGSNVSLLMPEPHRTAHDSYIARYLASGEPRILGTGREVDARRKDGSVFPVALAVGRIRNSDPARFVGFMHDLTIRRRAADEQQHMRQRMARVSHLATLGEMAGAIAHEINQPLAAIANYARACERLLQAPDPSLAEVQDALRQISGQALRAAEIIRRVRHLVRAREPRRDVADINALVREVSALVRAEAQPQGARVALELADGLPPLAVDGIQIQQVLLNLIHNAVEALASSAGAGPQVIVRTELASAGEIAISVIDSGPGVDPALADRIFDPFCTTKEHGTGLGLAISKSIVEAHHGRLGYRANEPTGACFTIRLPVAPAAP